MQACRMHLCVGIQDAILASYFPHFDGVWCCTLQILDKGALEEVRKKKKREKERNALYKAQLCCASTQMVKQVLP